MVVHFFHIRAANDTINFTLSIKTNISPIKKINLNIN